MNVNFKGLLIGVGIIAFSSIFLIFFSFDQDVEAENYAFSDASLFLQVEESSSEEKGYSFVNNDTILAQSTAFSPRESQVLGVEGRSERDSIISYKVKSGDSLRSVADKFEISEETIKWANSLTDESLSVGQELLILPTTGVLYYVERGDTLSDIAQRHKAKGDEIISFNDIEDETQITPGDQLIIPDGEKPAKPAPQQAPQVTHTGFAAVTHGTVTQGAHPGHANAVDIANNCGTPIYAGGAGTVTRTGSDPARAGNYIWIDHGGFEALYAHMQSIYVSSGQSVSAGQQIGTMGNTGYTLGASGCHIHFETRGASNPFSNMQRGQTMR